MRYILCVVELLKACDVTNKSRHLGFCQEFELSLKPQERVFFVLCMILAARLTLIIEKSWKNMYFHSKIAWPLTTYDVISRNHGNWHHWACLKIRARDKRKVSEMSGANVSSSWKKTQKNLRGDDNFRKIICSEDDLRSRIFGSFSVKFLACLLLLGFSNIKKMVYLPIFNGFLP